MRRGNEDGWSNATERSWCEMGRAGTKAGAGKDRARGTTAPPEIAGVLRGAHARLALWRLCTSKACRRGRRCGGDVEECGARHFPGAWAWLAQVAQAVRAGEPLRAAAGAADLAHMPRARPRITFSWRGWPHQVWEMALPDDESVKRVLAARARHAAEREDARTRRLAASHSPWLRAALRR
jgi:hypothetical protein